MATRVLRVACCSTGRLSGCYTCVTCSETIMILEIGIVCEHVDLHKSRRKVHDAGYHETCGSNSYNLLLAAKDSLRLHGSCDMVLNCIRPAVVPADDRCITIVRLSLPVLKAMMRPQVRPLACLVQSWKRAIPEREQQHASSGLHYE